MLSQVDGVDIKLINQEDIMEEKKKTNKYLESLKKEISHIANAMQGLPHISEVLSKPTHAEGLEKMSKNWKDRGVSEET